MKTVFSSKQVCHIWAAQGQAEGKNTSRSIWFERDIIYSYGRHFPMARIYSIGEGRDHFYFALVNSRTYSNTTSKHMSHVRSALQGRMKTLHVPRPEDMRNYENETHLLNVIADTLEEIFNSRKIWGSHERLNDAIIDLNQYYKLIQSKQVFALDFDTQLVVTKLLEEKAVKQRIKDDAKREKRFLADMKSDREMRERKARLGPQIDLWVSHANTEHIPQHFFPFDMVRVSKDKLRVETSRGAEVPLERAIRAVNLASRGLPLSGEMVGSFEIETEPDEKQFIKIGCHRISIVQARNALIIGGQKDALLNVGGV